LETFTKNGELLRENRLTVTKRIDIVIRTNSDVESAETGFVHSIKQGPEEIHG